MMKKTDLFRILTKSGDARGHTMLMLTYLYLSSLLNKGMDVIKAS